MITVQLIIQKIIKNDCSIPYVQTNFILTLCTRDLSHSTQDFLQNSRIMYLKLVLFD